MAIAPDVSFILVNYFSEEHTVRCVTSIVEKTLGVTYEIRIVDNHSGLHADAVRRRCPEAVILFADSNLGFGAGCNLAAKDARGTYLFFINNDSELVNDVGTIISQFLNTHPDAALAGAQLVSPTGNHIPSFDYFPTLASKLLGVSLLRAFQPEQFPLKKVERHEPCRVDLIAGACMFIRADVFRALGGFDPQFFLYCEEEDLAMRVHAHGLKTYFVPTAQVMHVGGGSTPTGIALKKEFYISFFRFYQKHYGTAKTSILATLSLIQFGWKYLSRNEKTLWGPLVQWMYRGRPWNESIRYLPGNIDGPKITS